MLTQAVRDALREFQIGAPPASRSVLLVDDEPENLESLSALLDSEYEVHTATSAAEALELLSSGVEIDLVVADQRMPEVSGVELLAKVAVDKPEIVRIVLTAYDDIGPMMAAINSGSVFRFLLKPCAPEEIRAAISEGLRTKHAAALLHHFIAVSVDRQDALDRTVWKLTRTRDYLLDAERLSTVGRSASGILHNIRNLGTLVSILVGEVQSSIENSKALSSGRAAMQGFVALVKLLEEIRGFTRISESRLELAPTELEPFLRQVVSIALLQDGATQCPVEIEVEPRFARLTIDRTRVRHALTAVLTNALRASPPGAKVRVLVEAHEPHSRSSKDEPTRVAIRVCDNGCGMDAATLDRATTPLFSGFSPKGLGLGLSAAVLATEIHGGDLSLESRPGHGTRVSLIFPMEPIAVR